MSAANPQGDNVDVIEFITEVKNLTGYSLSVKEILQLCNIPGKKVKTGKLGGRILISRQSFIDHLPDINQYVEEKRETSSERSSIGNFRFNAVSRALVEVTYDLDDATLLQFVDQANFNLKALLRRGNVAVTADVKAFDLDSFKQYLYSLMEKEYNRLQEAKRGKDSRYKSTVDTVSQYKSASSRTPKTFTPKTSTP